MMAKRLLMLAFALTVLAAPAAAQDAAPPAGENTTSYDFEDTSPR